MIRIPTALRRPRLSRLALVLAAMLTVAGPSAAAPAVTGVPPAPAGLPRVASMNLCTDQLAILIGAPGQVRTVSHWSARPSASVVAERAAALPLNRGLAEQIHPHAPDVVLAGGFSSATSVAMLQRLGVRVVRVRHARSFEDLRASIRTVGAAMERDAAAEALVAELDAGLAAARARAEGLSREAAAYHYANNFTSGDGTLADEILGAAGLDNAMAGEGLRGAARAPLELLAMVQPWLVRARSIGGAEIGRAYEGADHPVVARLAAEGGAVIEDRWQVCATPAVLLAVEALMDARAR